MGRRRSGIKWVCATVAPWALAAGVLVSFTAVASNDPQSGISGAALLPAGEMVGMGALVPPSNLRLARLTPALVKNLRFGAAHQTDGASDTSELPVRVELKSAAKSYPSVVRSLKSDPVIESGPSLSRRGRELGGERPGWSRLMFGHDESGPPALLMPFGEPGADPNQGFEPFRGPDATTTQQASSVQSPVAAAAGSTGAARGPHYSRDGATPPVARAVVLSSATPAPTDATPIEIAAAPVSLPSGLTSPRGLGPEEADDSADAADKSRYAGLINPDHMAREQRCLAQAIYFEARSEPEEGQAAVAQVVLNRVKSGLYPASVCGVVYQNRHRHLACQFTFTCEGKSLRVTDAEAWDTAARVARAVMDGKTYVADVGGATHYHADYVRPYWARRLKKMDVIGRHIFYKLRPGQT